MPTYRAIITVVDPWRDSHIAGGETVIEADKAPVRTGLLNAAGVPLYRIPEQRTIGFDLSRQPIEKERR